MMMVIVMIIKKFWNIYNFYQKTDIFFTIICEEAFSNNKFMKIYTLKNTKLTRLYDIMYLQLNDYPP